MYLFYLCNPIQVLNLQIKASEAGCANDHVSINGVELASVWTGSDRHIGQGAGNVQSIVFESLTLYDSPAKWESTCSEGEDIQFFSFAFEQAG